MAALDFEEDRMAAAATLKKRIKKLIRRRADTPWITSMTDTYSSHAKGPDASHHSPSPSPSNGVPHPTIAAFAPNQTTISHHRTRSTVLIHQKSPLLLATPPQVTRALAYSHPFILPLNHLAGLLSWTTGDPWESFLLVALYWFVVLYADVVTRYTGPLVLVVGLILAMYTRRYSPLSSTAWTGEKGKSRKRATSEETEQRKSLDEILDTLQMFTSRCNVLLDPLLRLTDFLSTQTTATAATTRPALTTLFIRILIFSPVWILLTLPPLRIITTQRIFLAFGTLLLTWHSRPARVSRTLLWRSRSLRNLTSLITGLNFPTLSLSTTKPPPLPPRNVSTSNVKPTASKPGVRFTFTLYENQRRWLGLGWTASLLAYERQAWTDEHLNETLDLQQFALPQTDHDTTQWRWAEGSEWRIEGAKVTDEKSAKRIGGGGGGDESGWTYYDTKWRDGRKVDGWGRYTRRRKWVRDAELVEVTPAATPIAEIASPLAANTENDSQAQSSGLGSPDNASLERRKGWFRKRALSAQTRSDAISNTASGNSGDTSRSRDSHEDDMHTPVRFRDREWDREIGEGLLEGLG